MAECYCHQAGVVGFQAATLVYHRAASPNEGPEIADSRSRLLWPRSYLVGPVS